MSKTAPKPPRDERDHGIAVLVMDSYTPRVHKETGEEILPPHRRTAHRELLFDPVAQTECDAWLTLDEAWDRIEDSYDWQNPRQYLTADGPVHRDAPTWDALGDMHVVIMPVDMYTVQSIRERS